MTRSLRDIAERVLIARALAVGFWWRKQDGIAALELESLADAAKALTRCYTRELVRAAKKLEPGGQTTKTPFEHPPAGPGASTEDRVHLDEDGAPEPTDDMPELTAEDWKHSIRASDARRMREGRFEPGDVEKLRAFLRLTPEEMAQALGYGSLESAARDLDRLYISNAALNLLRIAARHPGAFRRLVKP